MSLSSDTENDSCEESRICKRIKNGKKNQVIEAGENAFDKLFVKKNDDVSRGQYYSCYTFFNEDSTIANQAWVLENGLIIRNIEEIPHIKQLLLKPWINSVHDVAQIWYTRTGIQVPRGSCPKIVSFSNGILKLKLNKN